MVSSQSSPPGIRIHALAVAEIRVTTQGQFRWIHLKARLRLTQRNATGPSWDTGPMTKKNVRAMRFQYDI